MTRSHLKPLAVVVLALALVATACGGDDEATDTTLPAETTTTTMATTTTVAAVDVQAVAASYVAGIPEGWLAVSDTTAFKDAVAASGGLIVDVREPSEYAEGHLEGAINIPLRTLADNLDKIPTDRQVFIHCASGYRAAMAAAALGLLGYDNILVYPPGWKGWTAAGEPTTTEVFEAETVSVPDIDPTLLAEVDDFLSNIPEGWLSAGDVEKVKAAMDAGAFLLDVRTPEEYAKGYIGDAVNVNIRELVDHLNEIPKDQQVIVYCGSGHRAAMALAVLQILGYDNVKAFPGSYKAWTAAGEPVTSA